VGGGRRRKPGGPQTVDGTISGGDEKNNKKTQKGKGIKRASDKGVNLREGTGKGGLIVEEEGT